MLSNNKPTEEEGKSIFFNCLDNKFSKNLIEKMRKNKKNLFFGNLQKGKLPKNLNPIIEQINSNKDYNEEIFNHDLFIITLDDGIYEEIEYLIKGLKLKKHESKKTLILISNIMTWGKTKPKFQNDKKEENNENNDNQNENENENEKEEKSIEEEEEKKEEVNEEIIEEDDVIVEEVSVEIEEEEKIKNEDEKDNEDEEIQNKKEIQIEEKEKEVKEPKKYIQYKEKDYILRQPNEKYLSYVSLETLALSACSTNKNLNSYIVCPGFIYGDEENIFFNYFKSAWLEEIELPIINKGKNWIPTIHIKDLISIVDRIILNPPNEKYILAIDKTKNRSLNNIISSISKGVGNGKLRIKYEQTDEFKSNEIEMNRRYFFEELGIDVKIKSSKITDDVKGEEEEEEEFEKRKFKWHCEYGIPENIEVLRNEFNIFNSLVSCKVIVLGPPGSGKTEVSKRISNKYNIPHIKITDVVEYGKNLKNELGEEVLKEIEEEKNKVILQLQEEEQKKEEPKEVDQDRIDSIKEYLPIKTLCKVFKVMLVENKYLNRGYVLDGFPKSYIEAKEFYTSIDEEKPEDDETREVIISKIIPNVIVNLENDLLLESSLEKDILIERFKSKEENEIIGSHYNEKDMNRRLDKYIKENLNKGEYSTKDFFIENKIQSITVNYKNSLNQILDEIVLFIEKNGKINNFSFVEKKKEEERKKILIEELNLIKEKQEEERKINEFYEFLQKEEMRKENNLKKDNLVIKEANVLKSKSKDLQNYLFENVIPILSQGILEICRKCPEDPVDELARFLMEKSVNVAFKDPSKYKNS